MADVCKVSDNTLNTDRVPIIFVPGVMGSRLEFPAANAYWDPDSNWRMKHWIGNSAESSRTEMHFLKTANVMTASPEPPNWAEKKLNFTDRSRTPAEQGRGYCGVAFDFYVDFLRDLSTTALLARPEQTPVYAVGYDWRQSNGDSATYLDGEITKIMTKESGAKHFVLISHSMGGLVTRSFLSKGSANAGKMLGIIHLAQPARGAVMFYRLMYTGTSLFKDIGLNFIEGLNPASFATLLSGLRGPCELMPNDQYRYTIGDGDHPSEGWLWDERHKPYKAWQTPMFDKYLSADAPPGILWSIPPETDPDTGEVIRTKDPRDQLTTRVQEAATFHGLLNTYQHPQTWSVYSTGVDTNMDIGFGDGLLDKAHNKGVRARARPEGDGTVPMNSASALISQSQTTTDPSVFLTDGNMRQLEINGVEHSAVCNDTTLRSGVKIMLLNILGRISPPTSHASLDPNAPGDSQLADALPAAGQTATSPAGDAPDPTDWSTA